MKALVVYESMYGNTHIVADHIAEGLRDRYEVFVVPVGVALPDRVAAADLLVVGGPTHVHGMTSATSRRSAADAAAKPDASVALDPDATGDGLRDWFDTIAQADGKNAAAFDTRLSGPAVLTGRASLGIGRRLGRHGYHVIADPRSFIVGKDNRLSPGAAETAQAWGRELAAATLGEARADRSS